MTKINVTGIDPWKLLAELHNNTAPLGLGWLHHTSSDLTPDQAEKEATATITRVEDPPFYPDYLFGRPIKAFLVKDNGSVYLARADLYDRDCPTGQGSAQAIVNKLRVA